MKKYLQITVVLTIIGLIVIFKQLKGNSETNQNTSTTTVTNSSQNQTPASVSASAQKGAYKDGTYTGDTKDAFYGDIQVSITIANGKITKVDFLQFPNAPGRTTEVSQMALPLLKSEAIIAQQANVDIVSGATQTSEAFVKSLQSAIDKAKS